MQRTLFGETTEHSTKPFRTQLLKWVGNKQRFAGEIIRWFPERFNAYWEPFLGSGAVLGTLAPRQGIGSDDFEPLIEIWYALRHTPGRLHAWYEERWQRMMKGDKVKVYEEIKQSYNDAPNGADLLFLCRSCYGGVVRFRQADGHMSTPCGIHQPISPPSFAKRIAAWRQRTEGTEFIRLDYRESLRWTQAGDLVYCDPPYRHTQAILYGAQAFSLPHLFEAIAECKSRGVFVAVSIDGTKKSGKQACRIEIPAGLFEREVLLDCGQSMLRRFQMGGQTLEGEVVADRLLLTY